MKNEQTTVSLVVAGDGIDPSEVTARVGIAPTAERSGIWRLREGGPTSFEAPHVPEALARALLERVGERAGAFASYRERGLSYVRFSLWLPRLLRFSFELSPAIAARLAHTAGEIVFDIRDVSREESPVAFGEGERDRCDVELAISGAALDPDELTAALGVSPTSAQRAGEPVGRAGGRIAIEGRWSLETTCSPEEDVNDAARRLLAKLPPAEAVTSARGELALALRFVFFVDGQTGSFVLEPDVARALASLGAVFFVVVLNEGA